MWFKKPDPTKVVRCEGTLVKYKSGNSYNFTWYVRVDDLPKPTVASYSFGKLKHSNDEFLANEFKNGDRVIIEYNTEKPRHCIIIRNITIENILATGKIDIDPDNWVESIGMVMYVEQTQSGDLFIPIYIEENYKRLVAIIPKAHIRDTYRKGELVSVEYNKSKSDHGRCNILGKC
ncbi:MAG: hypothetical protein FWC00_05610 [Firmicutes bacterium]|nr:hypothetical protein [Bacillota bacterium]